jgi:hypothetical protein
MMFFFRNHYSSKSISITGNTPSHPPFEHDDDDEVLVLTAVKFCKILLYIINHHNMGKTHIKVFTIFPRLNLGLFYQLT